MAKCPKCGNSREFIGKTVLDCNIYYNEQGQVLDYVASDINSSDFKPNECAKCGSTDIEQ